MVVVFTDTDETETDSDPDPGGPLHAKRVHFPEVFRDERLQMEQRVRTKGNSHTWVVCLSVCVCAQYFKYARKFKH